MKYYYHCIKCGKKTSRMSDICRHDLYYEYIEILYEYEKIKHLSIDKKKVILNNLIPLKDMPVSLGEGNTPLLRIKNFSSICRENAVFIKNEGQNPTGSFKDRESSISIAKALELGYKKVYNVSSGNAALSSAVYANKAGLKFECFIPKNTSKAKKQMLFLYNSNLHIINGDYEDIYRKIVKNPLKNGLNITSGQNFFREEGDKKISYEIWEQIGVPDIVIVPIGNGSLISSIHKGFMELKKIGLSKKIPKIIGVQIKNASPIKEAIKLKKDYAVLDKIPESIAEGIIARESYCSPKVIRALKESNGEIIEISEKEIIMALKNIIKKESLTPEPTSAVVYAALNKFNIKILTNCNIVCIQTGNGIKNLEEIINII